jgi:hypothetical protein
MECPKCKSQRTTKLPGTAWVDGRDTTANLRRGHQIQQAGRSGGLPGLLGVFVQQMAVAGATHVLSAVYECNACKHRWRKWF